MVVHYQGNGLPVTRKQPAASSNRSIASLRSSSSADDKFGAKSSNHTFATRGAGSLIHPIKLTFIQPCTSRHCTLARSRANGYANDQPARAAAWSDMIEAMQAVS